MPLQPSWARGTRTAAASLVKHRDGSAQGGLAALEAPREAAEPDLAVQHLVELPAEVLDVDHVVRKKQRVHDLIVLLREDLVEAAAQLLLRLLRLIGADAPDHGVHGMVGASCVDREPAHAALQNPFREGPRRTRMADEISRLVHARAVGPVLRVVAVVPGPDDEDVAVLDLVASVLLPSLEMLRPVEVVIADAHPLQVDDACRA